jgi:hypothetical protein
MDDEHRRSCHRSDDAALLDRLARARAAVDPPPPELERLAGELLTWRTIDAELDELSRTGAVQAGDPTD